MYKNVLLALDSSSYAQSVLEYGKYFSTSFKSLIKFLHVIDIRMYEWTVSLGMDGFSTVMPSASFQEESQTFLEERGKEIIDKAGQFLATNKIAFQTVLEYGSPVDLVCEKGRLSDLLILGVKGEYAKWSKHSLGMIAETVSRECCKPILFVPNKFAPFTKILLAYDGSKNASQAMAHAAYTSEALKLPVTVISSHHDEKVVDDLLQEAENYLKSYKIKIDLVGKTGHPEKGIMETREEKGCDLIIMGAYGHSRIREAIIGSVTQQTLRTSPVPVMLIK